MTTSSGDGSGMPLIELGDDLLQEVCEFLDARALCCFEQCCRLGVRFTVSAWHRLSQDESTNDDSSNDAPRIIVERRHRLASFAMRMKREADQHYGSYEDDEMTNVTCPGRCNLPPFLDVVMPMASPEDYRYCCHLSYLDSIHEFYYLSFDVLPNAEFYSPAFERGLPEDVPLANYATIVSPRLPIQSEWLKTLLFEHSVDLRALTPEDAYFANLRTVVVVAKSDDSQGLQPSLLFAGGRGADYSEPDDARMIYDLSVAPVDTHYKSRRLGEMNGFLEINRDELWVRLILQHSTADVL